MLRITKMAPEGWAYYAREVAVGLDDYYGGHGEEPGWWTGRGAAAAGVDGRVEVEQLARLFGQGCHPDSGEALGRGWDHHDTDVVAGYSVSLSAPKSVSLLWGLGDRRLSQEVRAAHDAAVAATVAYLESHAAFSRAGKGGVFQLDSDGLLIAAYVHRTSRTLDPQLHTHLLVSAKVRRSDGAWRALDGRDLFAQQKAASGIYQAALRAELATRLGVEWQVPSVHGHADVLGVPDELGFRGSETASRGACRSPRKWPLRRNFPHSHDAGARRGWGRAPESGFRAAGLRLQLVRARPGARASRALGPDSACGPRRRCVARSSPSRGRCRWCRLWPVRARR